MKPVTFQIGRRALDHFVYNNIPKSKLRGMPAVIDLSYVEKVYLLYKYCIKYSINGTLLFILLWQIICKFLYKVLMILTPYLFNQFRVAADFFLKNILRASIWTLTFDQLFSCTPFRLEKSSVTTPLKIDLALYRGQGAQNLNDPIYRAKITHWWDLYEH